MSDSTIANLPSGSPAQQNDVLPIQRGNSTLRLSISDVIPTASTLWLPTVFWPDSVSVGAAGIPANTVWANTVSIPFPVTVSKVTIHVNGASAGTHWGIGVYDPSGTIQYVSVTFSTAVTGIVTITLSTPVSLAPGNYLLVGTTDSTLNGIDLPRSSTIASYPNVILSCSNPSVAGVLPPTLGTLTGGGQNSPGLVLIQ